MSAINYTNPPDPVGEPIRPDALAGVVALVAEATSQAKTATGLVSLAVHGGDKSLMPAFEHGKRAADAAESAGRLLKKLGAPTAPVVSTSKERDVYDLSRLAQMESPDMRRLLALLDEAQAVAERIDAGRGRVLPDDLPLLPGESRGTDLAEDVSNIAVRVRREVHGAAVGRE